MRILYWTNINKLQYPSENFNQEETNSIYNAIWHKVEKTMEFKIVF